MRSLYRICAAAALFLPILAGAQQPAAPAAGATAASPQAAATAAAHDRHIRLNIVVTDQKGNPITGLTQQDFTVLDEKQFRPIVSFSASSPALRAAKPPVRAILVIDSVNLTHQEVSFAREQIAKFLLEDGGHLDLPVSILHLTGKGVRVVSKPTTDGNRAVADLNDMESELRPILNAVQYGDYDRYNMSLRALSSVIVSESGVPSRKLLIWIGPGWPLLDKAKIVNPTNDQERKLFEEIVMFNSLLRAGQITLYSVSAGEPDLFSRLYRTYLKGVKSPQQTNTGDLGEEVLAIQTGGLVLGPDNDLAAQIARCMRDAGVFYTVTFDVPHAGREDEYHDLKVQVDKPGLTVRTSTGYYDQP
jgi:VWFA-related protein